HHLAAHLNLVGGHQDRSHGRVTWLQAHPVAFEIEALERGATIFRVVIDDGDRDLAIVDAGLRTNHHQVAIVDAVPDHGRAAHSQRVALVSDRPDGKLDVLVGIFDGLDRLTRGNATDDRDTHHARLGLFAAARDADQLQAARNLAVTADATLTLEDLEVV